MATTATVVGNVLLGNDCSIWPNAVVRGDLNWIHVDCRSNIQDGAVLHVSANAPLAVGHSVTVGHGVILHGCTVHDNCLIGMGSIVLDGAIIHPYCIVGAGTLITQKTVVPENSLVLGSPGKVVRCLTEEERSGIEESARSYVELAKSVLPTNSNDS